MRRPSLSILKVYPNQNANADANSGLPEGTLAGLFLEQQINIVDSQGDELIVWAVHVQQKTSKGNKDGPEDDNVS